MAKKKSMVADKRKPSSTQRTATTKKDSQTKKSAPPSRKSQGKIDEMLRKEARMGSPELSNKKSQAITANRTSAIQQRQEEQVLGREFLSNATSNEDLVQRLGKLQETLVALSQDDRPDGLNESAKYLVAVELLEHKEKAVRLGACCCLVEVLRVYAPEAPYAPREALRAFAAVAQQLRSLERYAGAEGETHGCLHLLESLATVKSAVILVELAAQGLAGAAALLGELFAGLLTAVRPEHPSAVQNWVLDVLAACLEECAGAGPPPAVLDACLACLLPANKAENLASYQIAQMLLARSLETVQGPISQFLQGAVVGGGVGAGGELLRSELVEHAYPLIYELHKVDTRLLLYALPAVATQLQSEETEARAQAVALLGRLFASSHAEYGRDYAKNFQEFLGRFKDCDVSVRTQMLTIGAVLLRKKPGLREEVARHMALRLQDPDAGCRLTAARELLGAAARAPEDVGEAALREVGGRLQDRRPNVRKEVAAGLARVFAAHVSRRWAPAWEASGGQIAEDEAAARTLGWVPARIALCYAYPCPDIKDQVLQLWDEVLVPRGAPAAVRAAGLAYLFARLDAGGRRALRCLLADRARARKALRAYLEARAAERAAPGGPAGPEGPGKRKAKAKLNLSGGEDPAAAPGVGGGGGGGAPPASSAAAAAALAAAHPAPHAAGARRAAEALHAAVDQRVFALLERVADPTAPEGEQRKAAEEAVRRLGSKGPAGEWARSLCRRAGGGAFGREALEGLLGLGAEVGGQDLTDVLQLVAALAEAAPGAFAGLHRPLERLFRVTARSGDAAACEEVLRLIAEIGCQAYVGTEDEECMTSPIKSPLKSPGKSPRKRASPALAFAQKLAPHALGELPAPSSGGGKKAAATQPVPPGQAARAAEAVCALLPAGHRLPRRLAAALATPAAEGGRLGAGAPGLGAALAAAAALARRRPEVWTGQPAAAGALGAFAAEAVLDGGAAAFPAAAAAVSGAGGGGRKKAAAAAAAGGGFHHRGALMVAALEVLVALLLAQQYAESDSESTCEEKEFKLQSQGHALFERLFGILDKDNVPKNCKDLSSKDMNELRRAAALGALEMAASPPLQALVGPGEWHRLAGAACDPCPAVRAAFLGRLCEYARAGRLSLRFLAVLPLYAADPAPALRKQAAAALLLAIRRRRQAVTVAQESQEESMESIGSEETEMRLRSSMPEYMVPYVIHLLAHRPDCSRAAGGGDPAAAKRLERCLASALEPLVHSLGADADNLAFLLQIVSTIQTNYLDAVQPKSPGIHRIANMAQSILRKLIKTQENLKPYPGTIYIPAPLFLKRSEANKKQSVQSSLPAATNGSYSSSNKKTKDVPSKVVEDIQAPKFLKRKGASQNSDASQDLSVSIQLEENSDESNEKADMPNWGSPVSLETSLNRSIQMESLEATKIAATKSFTKSLAEACEVPQHASSSNAREHRAKRRASLSSSKPKKNPESSGKHSSLDQPKNVPSETEKQKRKQSGFVCESCSRSFKTNPGLASHARHCKPLAQNGWPSGKENKIEQPSSVVEKNCRKRSRARILQATNSNIRKITDDAEPTKKIKGTCEPLTQKTAPEEDEEEEDLFADMKPLKERRRGARTSRRPHAM